MRRAARADTNQPDIVRTLRSLGASIWHTHTIGRGGPDIVVGYCGVNVLAEIKRDEREQLTLAEAQFHATWQGRIVTIRNENDALQLLEQIKRSAKF
jgi:Holliday junction resolvase